MQEGAYMQKILQSSEYCLLFALLLFHLFLTLPFLSEGFPRGGDFFFHYFYMTKTTEIFQAGESFWSVFLWNNYYNLGHPLFYYYQFLPYIIPALLRQFLSFDILTYFKFSLLLLYTLLPLSYYLSARGFGFKKIYSILFSAYFTFLSSAALYERIGGLSYMSYFQYGVYSFLFASIFFPYALVYGWKYTLQNMDERLFSKEFFLLVLFATITVQAHALLGGILFAHLFFLFVLQTIHEKRTRKETIKKGLLSALFLILTTAIVWLPASFTAEYYGGLGEAGTAYGHGFGWTLLGDLFRGAFFDENRFPFFTILFFIGMLSLLSLHRDKVFFELLEEKQLAHANLLLLFLFGSILFSTLLAMGIGKFFDYLPFTSFIALFPFGKFITAVQFFAGFFVCFGIGAIASYFKKYREQHQEQQGYFFGKKQLLISGAILLFSFFFLFSSKEIFLYDPEQYGMDNGTRVPSVLLFDQDPYLQEVATFLQRQEYGVLYLGNKTSTAQLQQMPEVLSYYTKKPVLLTGAGAFHETISTYYASFYIDALPITSHMNDLFNSKYIIFVEGNGTLMFQNVNKTKNMSFAEQKEWYQTTYPFVIPENNVSLLFFNPEFIVYQQNTSGPFAIVSAPIMLDMSAKEGRDVIRRWMTTEFPLLKVFMVFSKADAEEQNYPLVLSYAGEKEAELTIAGTDDYIRSFLALWQPQQQLTQNEEMQDEERELLMENHCPAWVHITQQTVGDGIYTATLTKEEHAGSRYSCFLLLKGSMHPDWKAFLITAKNEKIPLSIYHLSPSFMGINVDELHPGTYRIVFSFHFSKLREVLFLLSLLTLLCVFFVCHPYGIWISDKILQYVHQEKKGNEQQ